jgi:tetratricopeptide (TPR) repeat protein
LAEAKPYLERAMRADPKFAAPYFLLGDVFAREGQHRQAAPLLRKALELLLRMSTRLSHSAAPWPAWKTGPRR